MKLPSLFDAPPLATPRPEPTPAPIEEPAAPVVAVQEPAPITAPAVVAQPLSAPAPTIPGHLTEEDVKRALPSHLRASVTQTMVDTLNTVASDPIMAQHIRDNFVGYSTVLKDGKFKTEDYINAVAYVSFKLMGYSNEEAYARTFPQRQAQHMAQGRSKKDISAYVSAFAKGKLVNLIMEQSLVPSWVLNQDIYQEAINHQAMLMRTATSEKVQTEAANSLLTHLKKPEPKAGFQINLDQTESKEMKALRDQLAELAQTQQTLIKQGTMKTIDVAGKPLIDKAQAEDVA